MERLIFFDSYAIIEIIKGNENYEKFNDITITTNTLYLAEVFYSLLKEIDFNFAKKIIDKIDFEFIDISEEIALDSAVFRYKNRSKEMSYADCIGYMTSLKNNLKFLTGDKEFENLDNVEFVKK